MLLFHKLVVPTNDTMQFSIIQYRTLDTILFFALMFIFKPIELPPNFRLDLGNMNDENYFNNIYKTKLGRVNELTQLFQKKDIIIPDKDLKIYKNDKKGVVPIFVINPQFRNNNNNDNNDNNNNDNNDNADVQSLLNLFKHSQIGFISKE